MCEADLIQDASRGKSALEAAVHEPLAPDCSPLGGGAEISQTRKRMCSICVLAVAVSHLISQNDFAHVQLAWSRKRARMSPHRPRHRACGGQTLVDGKFYYTIAESARKTLVRPVGHFLRSRVSCRQRSEMSPLLLPRPQRPGWSWILLRARLGAFEPH